MGKISQGILGGISGKVGNVVGASWKGINYLRIMPASIANPRTVKQVNQRNKFTAAVEFLSPALAFLQVGYKFHQSRQSAYNAATAYVLNNAITGVAPDFAVDFPNALVSRGSLTAAADQAVEMETGSATISWDGTATGNAQPTDLAMVLIYNSAKKAAIVNTQAAPRSQESVQVSLPAEYEGDTLEIYLAFQAADGSAVSNSTHLGSEVAL